MGDHPGVPPNPLLVAGAAVPVVDADAFTVWIAIVHRMAREVHAVVAGEPDCPVAGRNHYRIGLCLARGTRLRVMLNGAIRLVGACREPAPGDPTVVFDEVPRGELFGPFGLRVAGRAELERPLTTDQTTAMTAAERRDIACHRPTRVGDVLFNWYD